MKTNIFLYSLVVLMGLTSSCNSDLFEDYTYSIPEIKLIDIQQIRDTTFFVIDVTDNEEPIELLGVSYKLGNEVSFSDNQTYFTPSAGEISLPMTGLFSEEEYSFIIFAGNDYSLGKSEIIKYKVPNHQGGIAPCELRPNSIFLRGFNSNVTSVINYNDRDDYYVISAEAGQVKLDLKFKEAPTTGVYTTTDSSSSSIGKWNTQVEITLAGTYRSMVDLGSSVIVKKNKTNEYEISFCELNWYYRGNEKVAGNLVLD